ncbi:MAG: hypothetical protein U0167_07665 [bacterium]
MKNQYFGDINDYRKYGLLRALQANGECGLLVAWMLTPDDGSGDGRLRGYLQDADTWMVHDPVLFKGLASLLRQTSTPAVALIEESGLLARTSYYSAVVPDARQDRDAWRRGLLAAARGVDLVFLDPDNGIEVPSKPVGRKGSSKYVTWQEIEGLWEAGSSVLTYQHFRRERHSTFAERMTSALRERTGARLVAALRTPRVLFLLAAQERDEARVEKALARIRERWQPQMMCLAGSPAA